MSKNEKKMPKPLHAGKNKQMIDRVREFQMKKKKQKHCSHSVISPCSVHIVLHVTSINEMKLESNCAHDAATHCTMYVLLFDNMMIYRVCINIIEPAPIFR